MDRFAERIRRPMLRRVYDYWHARKQGREFPSRADIDPLDLGFALGNLTLIDVMHDPLRFRYRLLGSVTAQRWNVDLTGKMVDEHPEPERRDFILNNYRNVVTNREPLIIQGSRLLDGRQWNFDSVIMPLAKPDGVIEMLLVCVEYHHDA
jgi:hypothetical protein